MTEERERSDPSRTAPSPPSAATLGPRRMRARLRADVRLARRQVWRTRGSSLLVLLLVMIPVAGMVGAAVFWQSHVPTREQEVAFELGRMQARVEIVGGEDLSRRQIVDNPGDWSVDTDDRGAAVHPDRPAPDDPSDVLPADARVLRIDENGAVEARTEDGLAQVGAVVGAAWDEGLRGRFHLVDGTAPTRPDQAMVSPGLRERFGLRNGDEITLAESGDTFTVTGTLRRADMRPSESVLFLPERMVGAVEAQPFWYVADWQPDLDELTEMNQAGFIVFARDLVLHPPAGAPVDQWRADTQQGWAMLATGSVVAVFSGYLVVLLAGAAFAVAARRQQRALAVAASVGATRGDVFRVVVLQGTVLGALGGAVGIGVGIALAAAVIAVTDEGAVGGFFGIWGFNIPWLLVLGILVFAVVVGTLSAVAPARAATRGDVLGALRGARRPVRLETRRPVWGLAVLISGVVATVVGVVTMQALDAQVPIDYASPFRLAAQLAIVAGPVVFQIGVLVAGHGIITVLAALLSRISLAARIASRDAAANPSRVVPAFAAIAACVFFASFGMSAVAVSTAGAARQYSWSAPLGSAVINVWGTGDGIDVAAERARALAASARPTATAEVHGPAWPEWDSRVDTFADPDAPVFAAAWQGPDDCPDCGGPMDLANGEPLVVTAEDLALLLPAGTADHVLAAFRAGTAVVVDPDYLTSDGMLEITRWTVTSQERYYAAMEPLYERVNDLTAAELDAAIPDPDAVLSVPALVVDAPLDAFSLLISPETAADLGIPTTPRAVIALFDEVQPAAVYDRIAAEAEDGSLSDAGTWAAAERGPESAEPWLLLILGAALVLVVGAGAVCLGLARFERRPDDATLTAVGGSRGLRRRVNAWQSVVIVGIGAVVGTIAGQIPMWGIAQTASYLRFWADAPWLWLAVLAVGLPVVVAAASWLVPPRHPDLTRRTAIA